MKKTMKKCALLAGLVLAFVLALVPAFLPNSAKVSAAEAGEIRVGTVSASAGQTVEVEISITKNPGIVAAVLELDYDKDRLTLVNATDKGLLPAPMFGNNYAADGFRLTWEDSLSTTNITKTGVLCNLSFTVKDNAPLGSAFISVVDPDGSIIDHDLAHVAFNFVDGAVNVVEKTEEPEPEPGQGEGNQGEQGNQGNQGEQGNQGGQGNQGEQGNQGNQGSQGNQGGSDSSEGCFGAIGAGSGVALAVLVVGAAVVMLKKRKSDD